ncbi:MAG: NAD(P)/FAD-dependent oxidoreductase [Candidatus Pacebacteria bacterium]|nr:NAD(P)/FAD-dependent oxidoreductase [Candidatus Paceibacterota bacterium]
MNTVAKKNVKIWDVVVIGGGPAGMMAAGTAAERGLSVLLLEKNKGLGEKLLITGGGRCNVTNAEPDERTLLKKYKGNDKFLFSPFSQFSVTKTLEFFNTRGMATKVEPENRVFPVSDSARSVWTVLVDYMKKHGVTVRATSAVQSLIKKDGLVLSAMLENGTEVHAKSFVLATGGKSRPETGSTGDAFAWLGKLGHTINDTNASLVPVAIKEPWVKKLQGVTLPRVKITLAQNGQKRLKTEGKILFTHFGVSGPTILNMSRDIGEALKYGSGSVVLSIDLAPLLDPGALNEKLTEILRGEANKKIKNMLGVLIPSGAIEPLCELADINPDTPGHSVTREERLRLAKVIKELVLTVSHLLGLEKAVVTSGGVALTEVDTKTMRSRLFSNLYLVGDVLNIDRPSGGYSLQLCWTTGRVAGMSV